MLPFLSQPAAAPACHLSTETIAHSQVFGDGKWLSRTPFDAGNTSKWSWSRWVMPRPDEGTEQQTLFSAYVDINNFAYFFFDPQGRLAWYERQANTTYWDVKTQARFRDSAPLHVLIEYDTAASTPVADRVRIYVNGTRQAVDATGATYADDWLGIVNRTVEHRIGRDVPGYSHFLRGMIADDVLLSGVTPGPTAWGEFNIHGVWVPKALAFTSADYGVTGHLLDFALPLNPGNDISGKGNHFTANGFDAAGKDTVASSPTNVYATFNILAPHGSGLTVADGGLQATTGGSGGPPYNYSISASFPIRAGKYAWKIKLVNRSTTMAGVGLMPAMTTLDGSSKAGAPGMVISYDDGKRYVGTTSTPGWGAAIAVGDAWVTAFDADTGNVWFGKVTADTGAVAWQGGGDPVAGTGPAATLATLPGGYLPFVDAGQAVTLATFEADFGQRGFVPPTGFSTLCTANLPEPEIKDPAEGYAAATGTDADIIVQLNASTAHWDGAAYVEIIKQRNGSENWRWRFSDDPTQIIASNNSNAKAASPALVVGGAYVGHRLRVGQKYGVWTAEVVHLTGTATTVTHGLATTRNAVIATRVSAGGGDRYFYHSDLTAGHLLKLNGMNASAADGTLTSFAANNFQIAAAAPSGTYRVIVMAQRDGFLDVGNYTGTGLGGNGGPFAPGTVLPAFNFYKRTDVSCPWFLNDAARDPRNPMIRNLSFDHSLAEVVNTSDYFRDAVVGGLKVRSSNTDINASGGRYVFISIGRPVGGVCVAPATAR
ncbi:MAG: hypothetical protein H7Y60_16450 [Rhodospirillaceae bacterium]|nr:hypothetical protein [Rhodospirillales bacterium]